MLFESLGHRGCGELAKYVLVRWYERLNPSELSNTLGAPTGKELKRPTRCARFILSKSYAVIPMSWVMQSCQMLPVFGATNNGQQVFFLNKYFWGELI